MLRIRHISIVLLMLFSSAASSELQMSVGIGLPSVNIGIYVPAYPEFVVVPGYPVYYTPQMEANYFFYDGLYWIYQDNSWYESSWYDGPWWLVDPDEVPLFILRVPVRYYRVPPAYFIGWQYNAPPRWGDYWGRNWSEHRRGWDRWDHHAAPSPAPLPIYQRNYSGDRYPKQLERQKELRQQNYGFQSRDPVVRKQNEHTQIIREQNQGQSYDRNRSKDEVTRDQKSMPNTQQQIETRAEQPNQRHEQRVIQKQEQQQQSVPQKERNYNQGNNQERPSRQEQSRERGNRHDD